MACCIHPAFIQDQLARSLERLNLATVDIYLLHNPEYYLSWASAQGIAGTTARAEYDRRLLAAFRHDIHELGLDALWAAPTSSNRLSAF